MKMNTIQNLPKKFLGLCAITSLLLFSACGNDGSEVAESEYGTEIEATEEVVVVDVDTATMDRASNTEYLSPTEESTQRKYDAATMGTAASNRKKMEASGTKMSDQDFAKVSKEYEDVNKQIRDALRQNPGVSMRYTDNNRTSDYNNVYYGVYYDGLTDENARKQFQELEKRRTDLQNQMRGKEDKTTKAYITAELDAVPAKGYDALYEFIEDEIDYPLNAKAARIEGTIFVEFLLDNSGNVYNPRIVETIDGQRQPVKAPLNPIRISEDQRIEAIQEMEKEAKEAVIATSGMWEPAMMGNQKVAQVVQLPVRFRLFTP